MSRQLWHREINAKFFYVKTYRWAGSLLLGSALLNVLLVLTISIVYLTAKQQGFYASSGILPPVKLSALSHPNTSAEPLLQEEPEEVAAVKVIPN